VEPDRKERAGTKGERGGGGEGKRVGKEGREGGVREEEQAKVRIWKKVAVGQRARNIVG